MKLNRIDVFLNQLLVFELAYLFGTIVGLIGHMVRS